MRESISDTIHSLHESIDQVGNDMETGQLNDNEMEMDMDLNVGQLMEEEDNALNMDVIEFEGVTPAVTNQIIHGAIDEAGEMDIPTDGANIDRQSDEFVIPYTIRGERVPITPHTNYRYRGNALRHLNFIEYCSIVAVVKRPQESETSESRGRPPNPTFLFQPDSQLHDFYCQRLRSKQATPILASVRPPPYPGDKPDSPSRLWVTEFNRFARYYLTAFCPWDIDTAQIPYSFDFEGYSAFARNLAENRTFLNRARTYMLESTIRGLMQNRKKKAATTMYRSLNADVRLGDRFTGPTLSALDSSGDSNNTGNIVQDSETHRAAVALLNDIQAEARQDDTIDVTTLSAGAQNAIRVAAALTEVLDSNVEPELSDASNIPANHQNTFMTIGENQAQQVLASIVLRPPPPIQLVPHPDILPLPIVQQQSTADTNTLLPLTEEHLTQDSHAPPDVLNHTQQLVYRICSEYLSYVARQRHNLLRPFEHSVAVPLLLIHGAPGTGKSFVVQYVQERALGFGIATNATSFTGSAAINLEGGQTINTLFSIGMTAHSRNVALSHLLHNSIAKLRITFRFGRSDQTTLLFVDEVSLVTSILLSMIEKRLKEIFDCSELFGGISVILLGDFQQLPPTAGQSLHASTVDHLVYDQHASTYVVGTPNEDGINLFTQFRLIVLTEQMRNSSDIAHAGMTEQLRRTDVESPVTQDIVDRLTTMIITPQDIYDRPEWKFAPVAVCGNSERKLINHDQASRFAQHHRHKLIQWRCDLVGVATSLPTHAMDFIYETNTSTLTSSFVVGAPAYLTQNMNPLKGIVNGAKCTLHSLSWINANDLSHIQDLLSLSPEGESIMLPIPPDFVNVELDGHTTWNPNDSLLGDRLYVIPVPIARKKLIVKVRGQQIQAKVHAVELGFSITFYKVEGKTLPLLILNLYKRGCTPEVTLKSLLVGLTRVRESRNVRLLPPPANSGPTPLAHLLNLKSDDDFRVWMAGYDDSGMWSPERALQAVASGRRSRTIRRNIRRTVLPPPDQGRPPRQGRPPIVDIGNAPTPLTTPPIPRLPTLPPVPILQTASPFFVPFLCAVAGLPHSQINVVANHVNALHGGLWDTLVMRTRFVHQYVTINGRTAEDKIRVLPVSWPWQGIAGQDNYIPAGDQEWLLELESDYSEIEFPPQVNHAHLTSTCGELLQQMFHDWQFARHEGRNVQQ